MDVQVIGLGTVGLPSAIHVSKYFDTIGYDIRSETLSRASKFINTDNHIVKADVYIVAVNTGFKNGKPDMSAVYDVAEKVSKVNKEALMCIESTVAVGTCRKIATEFGLERLVHCPHRYWAGDPVKHGVVQTRVLGALNEESLEKGKRFYFELGIPVHVVSSIEVAELSKIAENAYRFVQIAFAEELKMLCDELKLSFEEVRVACNTKWNVKILEARDGIGGHCLPKDIRYLTCIGNYTPLLMGAIETDANYKNYLGRRENEQKSVVAYYFNIESSDSGDHL
jgi:nucleotide sugar dehydrogenase